MVKVKALVKIEHRTGNREPGETLIVVEDLAKRWAAAGVCEIVGPVAEDGAEVATIEPEGETADAKAPRARRAKAK